MNKRIAVNADSVESKELQTERTIADSIEILKALVILNATVVDRK